MNSIVYNEDCIQGMKRYKDKHFDLAIVDPPYGIMDRWAKNHSIDGKTHITTLYSHKNGIFPTEKNIFKNYSGFKTKYMGG